MSADYAVVVSIAKSGTNLVAKLMQSLGYTCVGHGIRESYDEFWNRLGTIPGNEDNPKAGFSRPDQMLKILASYPPRTCLFLHKIDIAPYLLSWCQSQEPRFFFNFRDPRDTIVSLVNYLTLRANDRPTEMPWNMIYMRILSKLPSFDAQLLYAIRHMGRHTNKFQEHAWLLDHPDVCKIRYEEIVGSRGGGDDKAQFSTVSRILQHLGCSTPATEVCEAIFDVKSRTFHKGQIGSWRAAFKKEHRCEFDRKYGEVAELYGYPDVESGPHLPRIAATV